uniref:Uncharacterized protein n=1 Tax=Pipistrellus kuhlii TaxID=59472 RepID=A0A7J7R4K0_PIPKU|nr:hypothetical protein mPipKuh1_010845 [Pipistrellus kuhlii]
MDAFHLSVPPAPAFPPATACAFPAPRSPLLHLLNPPPPRPAPLAGPGSIQVSSRTPMLTTTLPSTPPWSSSPSVCCAHTAHIPSPLLVRGHRVTGPVPLAVSMPQSGPCHVSRGRTITAHPQPPLQIIRGKSDTERAHPAILDLSPRCLSSPLIFFKQSLTQKQRKKRLAVGHVLEASKMQPPLLAEI